MKLYEKLAEDIELQIRKGVYRDGDRLQSVRETSRQRQISITTVLRAESPRVLRRFNTLRGLSHEQVEQVLTRGA